MKMSMEATTIGILKTEQELVETVDDLLMSNFSRYEVSVQGNPKQLKDVLGQEYIEPRKLEDNPLVPKKSMLMPEDFGWALAFTIGLPVFIGAIIGFLMVGGVNQHSNLLIISGLLIGGLVGGSIGAVLANRMKQQYELDIKRQTLAGGFVIWIKTQTPEKANLAKLILTRHHADDIHCSF